MSFGEKAYLALAIGEAAAFIVAVMWVHLYLNLFDAKDRDSRRDEPLNVPIVRPGEQAEAEKLAA
jgi:hypothetical protein